MYDAYLQGLATAYAVSNSLRMLSYLPTILKLRRAEASADSYSQVTWMIWIFSNLTFGLMLFESSGRVIDELVLVPIINFVFCSVTSYYIWRLQRRIPGRENDFVHLFRDMVRELRSLLGQAR